MEKSITPQPSPAALAGETRTEAQDSETCSQCGTPLILVDEVWQVCCDLPSMLPEKLAAAASRIAQQDIDQFQLRMTAWGIRCFGQDHMDDPVIRGMRLLEEAIEFAQAVGVTQVTASALISYVYGREAGNPEQELGGVAVTLMACASALKRKLSEIIMAEIIRVESKGEKHFTERNQIKRDLGFK